MKLARVIRKAARAWQYEHAPLPPPESFTAQLASREAYDEQTDRSCMGN